MPEDALTQPLVSVLIPVFNREKLIVPCIRSALDQTLRDIEIVVVDNCSTDKTFEVCQQLAVVDSRLRVFRNEANLGPVRNWMRCAELARGRYGRILFSDDLMLPAALERSVPYLEDAEVGFVVTAASVGPEPQRGRLWYTWGNQNGKIASFHYLRAMMADGGDLPVSPCSSLFRLADIRRHLVLEIPSPAHHDFAGHGAGPDVLLSLFTALAYPAIVHLREPLAFFRSHAGSITQEKKEAVTSAYIQARVWFAGQCHDRGWLEYAFGIAWLQSMRRTRRWISPRALRTELLFPSDPQPRLLHSLFAAVSGWVLPGLLMFLHPKKVSP
jgi:hypothetical protein